MDTRSVYRLAACVIVGIVALLSWQPTLAQVPDCPNGSPALPLPNSTYPGTSAVCQTGSNQSTTSQPWFPCGSGITTEPGIALGFSPMMFRPPLNYTYPSGRAGLAFALSIDYAIPWPAHTLPRVEVSSYSNAGMFLGRVTLDSPYRIDNVSADKYVYYYVNAANLGCIVPGCQPYLPMQTGAYLMFDVVNYTTTGVDTYTFSSVRVVDSGLTPPDMCNGIPYPAPPQPTPTPDNTPTDTPEPTHTPTGTWNTPTPSNTPPVITVTGTPTHWPTSPPITPPPQNTPTRAALATIPVTLPTSLPSPQFAPIQLPEIGFQPPEMAAPTAISVDVWQWPVPLLGDMEFIIPTDNAPLTPTFGYTLSLPSLGTPSPIITAATPVTVAVGLTPNATIDAVTGVISGTLGDVQLAATRWYTMTSGGDYLAAGDTGIASTVESLQMFVENLALPIRYLKSLVDWFPNIWPFILFLLTAFAWINFVILAKFLIHNGTKILEVIRRIIELIPGF